MVLDALWTCTRGDAEADEEIAAFLEGLPLTLLIDGAVHHGLVGYLRVAIKRVRPSLLAEQSTLEAAWHDGVKGHLRTLADLAAVSRTFASADVPWLVVKGPALAEMVHPSPTLRPYGDLDIVVPGATLPSAVRALEAAGGRVRTDWQEAREQEAGELEVVLPSGGSVDLHWHLLNESRHRGSFRITMAELFDRARTVLVGSTQVRTLDPTDTVLHVALHGCLAGGSRLLHLKDLELTLEGADRGLLATRAREWGATLVLTLMLARLDAAGGRDRATGRAAAASWWGALDHVARRYKAPSLDPTRPSCARLVARATRSDQLSSAEELLRNSALGLWNRARPRLPDESHRPDDGPTWRRRYERWVETRAGS